MQEVQHEIEGMRPKGIIALQNVARELFKAKIEQKRAKRTIDRCLVEVAKALKQAGETSYGWKENGTLFLVTIEEKENVKLTWTRNGPRDD